jgi:protein involved in polysaccharide export with SLBB domain
LPRDANNVGCSRFIAWLLAVALVFASYSVSAQMVAEPDSSEPLGHSQVLEQQPPGQLETIRRTAQPFGHTLFGGGFGADESSGLNADYIVDVGDRVSIRIWGAASFDDVQTVDSQGNIFIPEVGPVKLGGTPNRHINSRVKSAVSRVYTNDVEVYTNLLTAQTISVYVTGYVGKPGKYSGLANGSLLNFIDKAGGINPSSGSFRDIEIVRNGKAIGSVDLYEFIQYGRLPQLSLKEGDAIVVKPLLNTVVVQGEAAKPFRFEFSEPRITGAQLMALATPTPGATHVAISKIENAETRFEYVTLQAFRDITLNNGDIASFRSDLAERNITVNVEGAHRGASALTVVQHATLRQVLDLIEVDPEIAAYQRIFIKRKSVAERQKKSIRESLQRLEAEYLTASSATDSEASIRAQEAKLISDFVRKVSQVEPSGTLVVASADEVADIILENDDTIVIPRKSPSVLVTGEVRLPRAFLWERSLDAADYIAMAGGYSNNANKKSVLVVKQDGRIVNAGSTRVSAGDELLVLPKAPTKNLQLATSITDILYKIAVATSVALSI